MTLNKLEPIRPEDFPVGSIESRLAMRAQIDARKTPEAEAEESFPGSVTFNFALSMAGPGKLLKYGEFTDQMTAQDVRWLQERESGADAYPFPLKLHEGQILERIRSCFWQSWIGDWGGMVNGEWAGDYSNCISSGVNGPERIVLQDDSGVWRLAENHGIRAAQKHWFNIEVYAGGWAGVFPENEFTPRFLTIKVEPEGHRLTPVRKNSARATHDAPTPHVHRLHDGF